MKEGFIPKDSIRVQARIPFTEPAKGVQIRLGTLNALTAEARNAGHSPSEAFNLSMIAMGKHTVPKEDVLKNNTEDEHKKNTNGWREVAMKRMLTREEFKSLSAEEQREYYFSNMNI